jgi:hypothetical protein
MSDTTTTDSKARGQSTADAERSAEPDPLLALIGSGKDPWADEHADEYVRRLREDWVESWLKESVQRFKL